MRGLLVACVLAGCGGSAPPDIDANPAGPRCSNNLFDLCFEEHDCNTCTGCEAHVCQNFPTDNFQVCSQACTSSTPCPNDSSGAPATCDNGVCKPALPNHCHL